MCSELSYDGQVIVSREMGRYMSETFCAWYEQNSWLHMVVFDMSWFWDSLIVVGRYVVDLLQKERFLRIFPPAVGYSTLLTIPSLQQTQDTCDKSNYMNRQREIAAEIELPSNGKDADLRAAAAVGVVGLSDLSIDT